MREVAANLLEATRQEAIVATRETQQRNEETIAEAQAAAQRELAAAAEQMSWTRATVNELIQTAELEAERIRQDGHASIGKHVRRTRRSIEDITSRLRSRLVEEAAEHERHAHALAAAAEDVRAAADEDAQRIRDAAEAAARRLREDAEDLYAETETRAQRRLEEVAQGARILRETVAEEVVRTQREAQDESRRLREEAMAFLTQARAEADQLRANARRMVEEAREELAALVRRREEITDELGELSGVIQALAVPTVPDPLDPTAPTFPAPRHVMRKEEDHPQ